MRKIISMLLCIIISFGAITLQCHADSFESATLYTPGNTQTGSITSEGQSDMYQFDLTSPGKLSLTFSADIKTLKLNFYDDSKKILWTGEPYWDKNTQKINLLENMFVSKGKCYFSVSHIDGEGAYSFNFSFAPSNESFSEERGGTNNKTSTANVIEMNQKYVGFIGMNDNTDMYRITIGESGIVLNLSSQIHSLQLKIYDEKGKQKWTSRPVAGGSVKEIAFSENLKLTKGTYVLSVAEVSGHGDFTFWFTDGGVVAEPKTTETVITVMLKGKRLPFDQHPIIENGRTLVPLRVIFEALDAYVKWDGETQTVIATKGIKTISLKIGSTQMYVNDTVKVLDVPAKLLNGRTLVPVRAVSEAFGCNVSWDPGTQTVIID